ncbi:TPA: diphthine--ammonia ligase [Candidatus Woesearchaeota archaeon]|nr:diphthine--ammonia ligase [Candidatus Woesearchaeota archaeon]
MRIGILFSSGKDSVFTLWFYQEQGWDIACLLSIVPKDQDSYMFQSPDRALLSAQANALGIPLIIETSSGEKEIELDDLERLLIKAKRDHKIQGVAAGALASDYQAERINRICAKLGLKVFTPLWHKDQERHMRTVIASGFDVHMTRIAADGLTKSWIGKRLADDDIDKLVALHEKLGINIAGEGGEFETIVLDGPCFKRPIAIEYDIAMESDHRGELRITKILIGDNDRVHRNRTTR